jgi:predicted nucleic acid-binding protein
MNGTRYVLDTNTLIAFFQGNPALNYLKTAEIEIPVIAVIEFLVYNGITEADKNCYLNFSSTLVSLN